MKYDLLYNFISPVTGRIKVGKDYILIGDKYGIGLPSPILIDIRQDIIDLRRKISGFDELNELNKLDHNRIWIGDYTNRPVMQKTIGVNNLPLLGAAQFPLPFGLESIALPNPTFSPTSPLAYVMSGAWLPQIYAGNPGKLDYTQTETIISSSLAMTQIKVAQALKRIDKGGLIVKSKNISFSWENPLANLIPESVAQLYDYGTTYTFSEAQALDTLGLGMLKNSAEGVLSLGVGGVDYVDTTADYIDDGYLAIMTNNDQKFIKKSTMRVINEGDENEGGEISGIGRLKAKYGTFSLDLACLADITAKNAMLARQITIYDYEEQIDRYNRSTSFQGPARYPDGVNNHSMIMPTSLGKNGDMLCITDIHTVIQAGQRPTITGQLVFKNVLPDGLQDRLIAQGRDGDNNPIIINANLANDNIWIGKNVGGVDNIPTETKTITINNLPDLTENKMWAGNSHNRPIERLIDFAPNDASYILKTPNATLTQAQVLSELGIGMAKIAAEGAFAIAIPDEDYATKATLEQIKAETEAFKNEAAASAEEAAASATEAAASAIEASASAVEATGAATTAAGSATAAGVSALAAATSAISAGSSSSSASSSASDAASSASNAAGSATNSASSATQAHDYLNTLLTTGITLQGDITGSGGLSSPITTTFIQNPCFTGKGSIKIPVGNTNERPSNSQVGMVRYNTEI